MGKEILEAWRKADKLNLNRFAHFAEILKVGDAMAAELEALEKRFVVLSEDLYKYIKRNGKAKVRIKKLKAEIAGLKEDFKQLRGR